MAWILSRAFLDSVNSPCSQAQAAESLAVTCSDGELSAQSNSNPTPQLYLPPDKMKAFSRLSRFGMTFAPLTESRGAELLTLYLADFPVRTSALPDVEPESTATAADFDEKWQGSFARYDRDSCSWKTAQSSLLGGLVSYSETWPRSGTMRNGKCWELPIVLPLTSGTVSGSWPTPTASAMPCEGTQRIMRKAWQDGTVTLEEANAIAWRDVRLAQGKVPSLGLPETQQTAKATLNPTWVEWLMAWPLAWTDLQPLATDKFRSWRQQLFCDLLRVLGYDVDASPKAGADIDWDNLPF